MEYIDLEIANWDKHQPRKDIKHPTWFALSNGILDDAKLFALTSDEFKALIYIFCQASKANKACVRIYFDAAAHSAKIPVESLRTAIDKLTNAGVTCTSRTRTGSVRARTQSVRIRNATDTTDTTLQTNKNNAHAEAFALFWQGYPNKRGKSKAEAQFKKLLAKGKTPDQIMAALAKYRTQLTADGTEAKYVLHGPTFLNRIDDFLAADYGQSEDFDKKQINWAKVTGAS